MCIELVENPDCYMEKGWKQDEGEVSGARKITVEMSYINWQQEDADDIINKYRGLYQSSVQSIRTIFNHQIVVITGMQLLQSQQFYHTMNSTYTHSQPGSVWCGLGKSANKIFVKTINQKWITITKLKIQNQNQDSAKFFIANYIEKPVISHHLNKEGAYFFNNYKQ